MASRKPQKTMRLRPESVDLFYDLRAIIQKLRAAKGDKRPISQGEILDIALDGCLVLLGEGDSHLEKSHIWEFLPVPEKKSKNEMAAELEFLSERIEAMRLKLRGVDLVVNTGGRILAPGEVTEGERIPIKSEPESKVKEGKKE